MTASVAAAPTSRRRKHLFASALAFAFIFGGLVPVLATDLRVSVLSVPVVLCLAILWLATFRLALLVAQGLERPIQAVFWLFVYVWFGLAALAQTAVNRFPLLDTAVDDTAQTSTLMLILAGLGVYQLGIHAGRAKRLQPGAGRWRLRTARVQILAWFAVLVVGLNTARLGLATRFSSRLTLDQARFGTTEIRIDRLANKAGGAIISILDWMPVFVGLFAVVLLMGSGQMRLARHRRLLSVLAISNLVVSNPIVTPRFQFGGIALSLYLAWRPLITPRRVRLFVLGMLCSVLIVYPVADYFRVSTRTSGPSSLSEQLTDDPDFSMFQMDLAANRYVSEHGFTFGTQLLGAILVFVPRVLWPEKPTDTGDVILGDERINASSSLWATSFVDGGLLAVCIVMFLLGYASELVERVHRRRSATETSLVRVAVPLIAGFQLFLLRGDLQPAFGVILPMVFIVVILCAPVRGRQ